MSALWIIYCVFAAICLVPMFQRRGDGTPYVGEEAPGVWTVLSIIVVMFWLFGGADDFSYSVAVSLFTFATMGVAWWVTAPDRRAQCEMYQSRASKYGRGWIENQGKLWALGERISPTGRSIEDFERLYKDTKKTFTKFYERDLGRVVLIVSPASAGGLLYNEHLRKQMTPTQGAIEVVALTANVCLDGDQVRMEINSQLAVDFGFFIRSHGPRGVFYQGDLGQPISLDKAGLDYLVPA